MQLTPKQKKFAEYYVQSGNMYKSAIAAGYTEKYAKAKAHLIPDNPEVAEFIKQRGEAASRKRIITALKRQEILSRIAVDEEEETNNRIKAIDTLNKMTGEYIINAQVTGGIGVTIIDDIKDD